MSKTSKWERSNTVELFNLDSRDNHQYRSVNILKMPEFNDKILKYTEYHDGSGENRLYKDDLDNEFMRVYMVKQPHREVRMKTGLPYEPCAKSDVAQHIKKIAGYLYVEEHDSLYAVVLLTQDMKDGKFSFVHLIRVCSQMTEDMVFEDPRLINCGIDDDPPQEHWGCYKCEVPIKEFTLSDLLNGTVRFDREHYACGTFVGEADITGNCAFIEILRPSILRVVED